jgi:putative PIN family toxin of toxin-antitoxin system
VRLLLDTNVLVAALLARGTCHEVLEHCIREHLIVSSAPLLEELGEVLDRKFRQRAADVQSALRLFTQAFTLVEPSALDVPVCRDRDDDVVLATALTGACGAIVTGDQDLLILDPFRGIRVITPTAFWQWESPRDEG